MSYVTGEALYTDDLTGRFPNLLHAWPTVAPHAHAEILSLDAAPALAMPGVVAVLTGADNPAFPAEVLFHSQPVAWVLADTLEAARLGAEAVRVVYRPLTAILTIEDAIAARSFLGGPHHLHRGTPEPAPHRLEGTLHIGGQEHFYLETQASIAWRDESGSIALHCGTQHPAETQEAVAHALGLPLHQVVVQCLGMGGAFGGKEVQANYFATVAAVGVLRTGRPVRVRLPRHLDMAITGKRHPFLARFEVTYHDGGRLESARIELFSDGGWNLDLSEPVLWRAMFHCDNCYLIPALAVTGTICKTHKTSQTAFRGFGGPQGMLVIEDIMDRVARSLSLPPDVVRERNFYSEGDTTHYDQPVKDAGRITRIWRQIKETSRYAHRRAEVDAFNAAHGDAKRGLAITPVKFGISFTATFYNQAGALVLVYRDGTVQVNHGGTEMGQGLHIKIRNVAARALGVPLDLIRIMTTSTDKVPNTSATAASSGADLNGAAVRNACEEIRARLEKVDGAHSLAWKDLVEAAYMQRVPLFAHGYYRTPGIHYDRITGKGHPFYYFAYGAAVAEVEVDGFTGVHRILRADLLEDVGESLAPVVDRGQIEGGFIQGVGWLTLEELVWDAEGRLVTNGASTYKLPSWTELPDIFEVNFLERAAEPGVIYGSKAVGEPPLMLALSVREALRDAIAAFGKGGVVAIDSPLTPERIFFAVEAARQ